MTFSGPNHGHVNNDADGCSHGLADDDVSAHLHERGAPDHGHGTEHDHDHDHEHPGHDHEHGHDHDHGWWGRFRHAVSDFLGGHSHDATDQIDDALEANEKGRRALWISLAGLGATAILQALVVVPTGSVALLGDTLHNVADALTAVPLLIAFGLARRAANDRFTYGYGRAEDLAGLFVVLMIALSAVLAGYEAIQRLLNPQPVNYLWAVAAAGFVGYVGNELVARYRIKVGRQIGSAALVADGLHARTDSFTSLAVLISAGGVAVGWDWADPVIGLVITVAILGVLRSAVRQVGARLMDAVDPDMVARARATITTVDGVSTVRTLRMRWIGHALHAEADVTTRPQASLVEAHDLAHHIEDRLLALLPRLSGATVHVSPEGGHP